MTQITPEELQSGIELAKNDRNTFLTLSAGSLALAGSAELINMAAENELSSMVATAGLAGSIIFGGLAAVGQLQASLLKRQRQ